MSTRSGVLLGPRSLATITLLASLSASCGGVDEQPPPSTDDAATAAVVCGELKAFDNRVVRLVNQAVLPVQDQAPDERVDAMIAALGQVDLELVAWREAVERLELSSPEADRLRAELREGAESARSEVSDVTADLAALGRIEDDNIAGGVGQLFTSIEKVLSEVEPSIAAYDRASFRRAFVDTPDCRHVTQLPRP